MSVNPASEVEVRGLAWHRVGPIVPRHRGNPVIFLNVTHRRLRFVRGQWFATPEQVCFCVSAPALGPLKVAPVPATRNILLSARGCVIPGRDRLKPGGPAGALVEAVDGAERREGGMPSVGTIY